MAAKKLSDEEIQGALADLPGWTLAEGKLHRELSFTDFSEAFAFMTRLAMVAEQMGHHPEWFNVYNRLTLDLTTHDAGGISELDFAFARRVEAILGG